MGKQYNKVEKRRRRERYLKRKKTAVKLARLTKTSAKPAVPAGSPAPVPAPAPEPVATPAETSAPASEPVPAA